MTSAHNNGNYRTRIRPFNSSGGQQAIEKGGNSR